MLRRAEVFGNLPSSGFSQAGFGSLLAQITPATGMLISVGECPTIEQVLADEENLPDGAGGPVTFAGPNGAHTDEWLFVSEIKPKELSFTTVRSLRLVARPRSHPRPGAQRAGTASAGLDPRGSAETEKPRGVLSINLLQNSLR